MQECPEPGSRSEWQVAGREPGGEAGEPAEPGPSGEEWLVPKSQLPEEDKVERAPSSRALNLTLSSASVLPWTSGRGPRAQ